MANEVNDDLVRFDFVDDQVVTGNRRNFGLRVAAPKFRLRGDFGCRRIRCGRQVEPPLPLRDVRKNLRDRRARRVRTGASCVAVAAENCLNLFVAHQIAPGGAFFSYSPFLFGNVIGIQSSEGSSVFVLALLELRRTCSDVAAPREAREGEAWCPWPESNQHSLRNSILSRARLPVPPQGPSVAGRRAGAAKRAGI